MNGNYSKLKEYVNMNKGTSSISSSKSYDDGQKSLFDFFKEKISRNDTNNAGNIQIDSKLSEEQTDSWFKQAESDPFCPKLTKTQRIIGFMIFLIMGVFCMCLASLYIPVIVLKSRKFVLLFSMGSLFFISSFSLLWGVKSHLKHLFNSSRLPFTLSYFSTLFGTIYYALFVKSVFITLIFSVLQLASLIWYIVSYLPGGQSGLKFFTKVFYSLVSKTVQSTFQV